MRRMHWSWEQLQQTPLYVRRFCLDFLNAVAEQQEREQDQARSHQQAAQRWG